MIVYRITTAKWASRLSASGYPARWNPKNVHVIYTAGSAALACLENLVHRSGEGLNALFRLIEIEIPDSISSKSIQTEDLPPDWHQMRGYTICQVIGKQWIEEQQACTMNVPSSIIPVEKNILINPHHPEFKKISIQDIKDFSFDKRLQSD